MRRYLLNFQANGEVNFIAGGTSDPLKEGDNVAQGQVLASIDARRQSSDIQTARADVTVAETQRSQRVSQLNQAIAQRNQTETQYNQAVADLRIREANFEQAQADLELARTELQRYQSLFEQGVVSESDRDVYRNQVSQAEASLETARQNIRSAQEAIRAQQENIRSAEDDIATADANISAADARLDRNFVDLEDTQLVSPSDGVVAYINIREGEYWSTSYLSTQSAQDAIKTAPIVVVDPRSYEVELEIQADEARAIDVGQTVYVVLESEVSSAQAAGASQRDLLELAKEFGSQATVFSVSPAQTPGSRGTQVKVRDFSKTRNLQVGDRVYVWIEVAAKPESVVLPLGSLLVRDGESFVFVVDEATGTVQRRRVATGVEGLDGIEVLAGVEPGDAIVVEGQNRLVDGAPVEIIDRE